MEFIFDIMMIIALSLLLTIGLVTSTGNGVQTKYLDSQKTTSSTLQWVPPPRPGVIPKDAVVGSVTYFPASGQENIDVSQLSISHRSQLRNTKIYICRSCQNGNWIPGALVEQSDTCIVATFSKVFETKIYDVLVNVDGGARLKWTSWEKQVDIPRGAVAAGEYYIAHSASPRLKVISEDVAVGTMFRIGNIDPSEGIFGRMTVIDEDNNVISDLDKGEVLVEIEPILYELTVNSLVTSRSKVRQQKARRLGEVTLRNEDDRQMKAESVITYSWQYESNWGHGKAMLKALNTSIQFINSTHIETIQWGMAYVDERDGVEKVETVLEAGTARHVTVDAVYQEVEVPYVGNLLSVFPDKQTMNRTVHEVWRYTTLTNIRIEYGPAYFLQNNSLVPTTSTTTTEAPTTVTSWTTHSPRPTNPELNVEEKLNTMLPPRDVSHNDLADDNSDALQLKNKETSGNSATRYLAEWSVLTAVGSSVLMRGW